MLCHGFHVNYILSIYVVCEVERLHEKPYFPILGISQKAQKHQANIILPSNLGLK